MYNNFNIITETQLLAPDEVFVMLPFNDPYFNELQMQRYCISNYGRLLNIMTQNILKPYVTSHGFNNIKIEVNNRGDKKAKVFNIDLLVLLGFDYRPDFKDLKIRAVHLNWNTLDDRLCNLAWSDGYKNGKKIMIVNNPPLLNVESYVDEQWYGVPPLKEFTDVDTTAYLVSNYGRVYSVFYKRLLNPVSDKDGYLRVKLSNTKIIQVHKLVMLTFNFNPLRDELQVNHIDGDKTNNHISNLEWATPKQNITHSMLNNLTTTIGENMWNSKNSQKSIYKILDMYFDQKLSPSDIDFKTLNVNGYTAEIIYARNRVKDVLLYFDYKGVNIAKIFNIVLLNKIKSNCTLPNDKFNDILQAYGVTPNTYAYVAAHIAKRAFNDVDGWLYATIFK